MLSRVEGAAAGDAALCRIAAPAHAGDRAGSRVAPPAPTDLRASRESSRLGRTRPRPGAGAGGHTGTVGDGSTGIGSPPLTGGDLGIGSESRFRFRIGSLGAVLVTEGRPGRARAKGGALGHRRRRCPVRRVRRSCCAPPARCLSLEGISAAAAAAAHARRGPSLPQPRTAQLARLPPGWCRRAAAAAAAARHRRGAGVAAVEGRPCWHRTQGSLLQASRLPRRHRRPLRENELWAAWGDVQGRGSGPAGSSEPLQANAGQQEHYAK